MTPPKPTLVVAAVWCASRADADALARSIDVPEGASASVATIPGEDLDPTGLERYLRRLGLELAVPGSVGGGAPAELERPHAAPAAVDEGASPA